MINANRFIKGKGFGGLLRNGKNLNRLTKNQNTLLEYDSCCSISRKVIYFTDIGGKPTKIKYPLNFNGKTVFNNNEFSKALTEYYGSGYIVYISSPGNAVVLGAPHKTPTFAKDCCLDAVKIETKNLDFPPIPESQLCNCGVYTRVTTTTDYLNAIVEGDFNYLLAYNYPITIVSEGFTYVELTNLFIDLFEANPGVSLSSIFGTGDVQFYHFSCSESISNSEYSPDVFIGGNCNCTTPVQVETAGDLIDFGVNNSGIIFLHVIASDPFSNDFFSLPAIAYRLTVALGAILQSVPANTPLIDIDLGLYTPGTDSIAFFRASACPVPEQTTPNEIPPKE